MNSISIFQDHCCGCGLCKEICPCSAITMVDNEKGFTFPKVDEKICIECGLCVADCSFNQTHSNNECIRQFLVQHKDLSIRMDSRSGGTFTALSDEIINRGGTVYGCKLTSSFFAEHSRADNVQDRDRFLGSKYTQSLLNDSYKRVKDDLQKGKWVLFSGTPCQVDAIKSFCGSANSDKLILIDIVCFGIPGRKLWRDYLDTIESVAKSRIKRVDFRNKKKYGWANHIESVEMENGKSFDSDLYARLFGEKLIIREACFRCPYKNLHRTGDITLADAWGINDKYSKFNDDKGTSLVLINSEKGNSLFNGIQEKIESIELEKLDDFMQPCLKGNWPVPEKYKYFWDDYNQMDFEKLINKYLGLSVINSYQSQNPPKSIFRRIIQKLKK